MLRRQRIMEALAAKNITADALKKEQGLLTTLQERATKIEQDQKNIIKKIAANEKRIGLYSTRIKSQYMKLEVKEEEPAEGLMKWAEESFILNVKSYYKEIKQLNKENKAHERNIQKLKDSLTYVLEQIVFKKLTVVNLQNELAKYNKPLEKIYPAKKHTLNAEKANSIVNTEKGSISNLRQKK